MIDLTLDLSGLIGLLVCLAAAAGLGICCIICGVVAAHRSRRSGGAIAAQPAFWYLLSAALLVVVNLVAFAILAAIVDDIGKPRAAQIDKIALFAWLPAQIVLWLAMAAVFNRSKLN